MIIASLLRIIIKLFRGQQNQGQDQSGAAAGRSGRRGR
jgi:hypothetical protein